MESMKRLFKHELVEIIANGVYTMNRDWWKNYFFTQIIVDPIRHVSHDFKYLYFMVFFFFYQDSTYKMELNLVIYNLVIVIKLNY